ncbi:MAG: helix-turn-helix domain-containing protein [Spirochaetia bacterium]
MNDPKRLFVTPRQVREALNIGRATLYRRLKDGTIPSVRIGRLLRIPLAALEEMTRVQRRDPEGGGGSGAGA